MDTATDVELDETALLDRLSHYVCGYCYPQIVMPARFQAFCGTWLHRAAGSERAPSDTAVTCAGCIEADEADLLPCLHSAKDQKR